MQNSEIFHPPEAEEEVTLDDLAAHYPVIESEEEPTEEPEAPSAAPDDELPLQDEPTSSPETTPEHVLEEEVAKPEQSEHLEHLEPPPLPEIAPQEVVEDQVAEHAQDEYAGAINVQDAEDIPTETPRSIEAESEPAEVVPESVGFQAPLDVVPPVDETVPEESVLGEEPSGSIDLDPESTPRSEDLKDEGVTMRPTESAVTHEVEEVGNPEEREDPVEEVTVDEPPIEYETVHEEEKSNCFRNYVVDVAVHDMLPEPETHEAIPQVEEPLIEHETSHEQEMGSAF